MISLANVNKSKEMEHFIEHVYGTLDAWRNVPRQLQVKALGVL